MIIISVFFISCNTNSSRIDKLIEKANVLYSEKEYEQVIKNDNEIIKLNPQLHQIYFQRSLSKYNTEDLKGALEDINNAINIKKEGEYFYHKARFFEKMNKIDSAIAYYTLAVKLDSNLYEAFNNRGLLYKSNRKYQLALTDFNKALELDPNNSILYNNRATLYQELENQEKAIEDFTKAIKINELSYYYRSRAASYAFINKFNKALSDLNKAIELDPSNSMAFNDRGLLNNISGDRVKACSDWKKAEELGSTEARYYINKFCL